MSQPNMDYMTKEDVKKIMTIYAIKKLTLGQIGKLCEVSDSGYWSRILHGKKPVPVHVRAAMTRLFSENGV